MKSDLLRQTVDAIHPVVDRDLAATIQRRLDSLTKPPGSLGRLEEIALRYGLIRGTAMPAIGRKALLIFCADHGVVEERVSPYPAEVTRQMVANFVAGGAAITVLCRHYGIDPVVIDVGVQGPPIAGALDRKVAPGTANFTQRAAMSRTQAERSLEVGIEFAQETSAGILGAGEMGIGNTTAAAALFSAFAGLDPADTAGRGTGVDDAGLERKTRAICTGLAMHAPDPQDPIGVLAAVGGFEIGAIAGLILGAAARRVPVMLDGFISCAGALVAKALAPASLDSVFFSHRSAERAHDLMLEFLGGHALLDLEMRLGEGSGAALGINLVEASVKLYREMATFDQAGVSKG